MADYGENSSQTLREMSRGSTTAFEDFYEQFVSLVFGIAFRMTGDQMEAEDVCHDVFMEVLKKADQFDPGRGSVQSWLAVKTKSRCLDRLRRKQRFRMESWDDSYEPSAHAATDEMVLDKLEKDALRTAIGQIPAPQRKALYGMYYKSQTHKQLAQQMHKPLGTVKSLVRYGIQNIKKQFTQHGWMEPTGGADKNE